jgi:hypothetical protein
MTPKRTQERQMLINASRQVGKTRMTMHRLMRWVSLERARQTITNFLGYNPYQSFTYKGRLDGKTDREDKP